MASCKGTDLLDGKVSKNNEKDIIKNDTITEQQTEEELPSKVKRTALEARHAVEDFLEKREYHLLYDEIYT